MVRTAVQRWGPDTPDAGFTAPRRTAAIRRSLTPLRRSLPSALDRSARGEHDRADERIPGAVAANTTQNSGVAIPSMGGGGKQPEVMAAADAGRMIVDGMARDRYRVLVGSDGRLIDALYRLSPGRAAGFIANRMKALLDR